MRFEQLSLRVPGDEIRMRFHERMTVLTGIGALEREALVDCLLGALAGDASRSTVLTYVDGEGRRVTVAPDHRDELVHLYDDGTAAPDPVAILGIEAAALRAAMWIQAADLGLLAPDVDAAATPELAEARSSLTVLNHDLQAALAAREAVEGMREELALLDERLRDVDEGKARRRYARLLLDLERVRAEAAALRGGEAGAEADRRFISTAQEAHRLSEHWHRAAKRLGELQRRWANRERLDPRALEEAHLMPERVPEGLDVLADLLRTAEERRDQLAARLSTLAASRLPEPSHPAVVRLAGEAQDAVWAAAQEALDTKLRLEQESLALGGLPAEGMTPSVAAELEAAHAAVEQAESVLDARRTRGQIGMALSLAAGLATVPFVPLLVPAGVVGAGAVGLWSLVLPRRQIAEARGHEEDVLVRSGVPTWLGFHMRRIDVIIDPRAAVRLEATAVEHRRALSRWHEIAGDLDPVAAVELEPEVRAYAAALADLGDTAGEIEAVRHELTAVAEPAARQALEELMSACEPYGIDDPSLAVSMVRHQVEQGRTARLQVELEAAEREEASLRREVDNVLAGLGYGPDAEGASGDIGSRISLLDRSLAAAAERERARAGARSRHEVESELVELEARARQEHRPEFGVTFTAEDTVEPDAEQLRRKRDETARAYENAVRMVPDIDLLADRRNAVERRVTVLEAALGDTPAASALASVEDIERYLLARLASARHAGTGGEALPIVLDEPFLRIRGERKWHLLDLVDRLAAKLQLIYLTDDPDVLLWARRRAGSGTLLLLEPAANVPQ